MASMGPAQPSPQVVGAAFVQQYYYVLHRSPDQVHKFYQDSSILSRPDSNGMMTTVTTIQDINDKLLSLDFSNYTAEIESADSQASYKEGVLVVVTGSLTGRDNVCRKFTQSFFLAPQERGGYVVLNDIFRFVDPGHQREMNQVIVNGTTAEDSTSLSAPELEPALVPEALTANTVEHETVLHVEDDSGNESVNPPENGLSEVEDPPASDREIHSSQPDDQPASDVTSAMSQEDGYKKSYASIVLKPKTDFPKGASLKPASSNHEKQLSPSSKPSPATEIPVPTSNSLPESNSNSAVEGYSIYIRNLPLSTTPAQVEEEFKKFGPIKKGGVQVRNHKVERFCFGFVEFESLDSMQAAIKASPITLGGRQAYIEEKRTTTRVVNGVVTHGGNGGVRGRYQAGRGVYPPADNFRGRGGFGNGQGYVRTEFRGRGEYSGRGRGGYGRPSSSYQQRPFQNGNAKIFRPLSASQTAVSV